MGYIKERLGQVSTWLGFAIAGFSLYQNHGSVTPEITTALLTALGLVHINDKSSSQ